MYEYCKSKLSPKCASVYECLLSECSAYSEDIDCGFASTDEVSAAYIALSDDHPELFWLPREYMIKGRIMLGRQKSRIEIKNIYSRSEIRTIIADFERVKAEILRKSALQTLKGNKEKVVCDFILSHTKYEVNNTYNQDSSSAIYKGRAQCSGISKAVKLMLDWVGIDSVFVRGESKSSSTTKPQPHAWNIVFLDGIAYQLDVTFMLGSNRSNSPPFNYSFFNYTDFEMRKLHSWDENAYPVCNREWREGASGPSSPSRPLGAVSAASRPAMIISPNMKSVATMFELKQELKRAVLANRHYLEVFCCMPFEQNELYNKVGNVCKFALKELNVTANVTYTVGGNGVIKIKW